MVLGLVLLGLVLTCVVASKVRYVPDVNSMGTIELTGNRALQQICRLH